MGFLAKPAARLVIILVMFSTTRAVPESVSAIVGESIVIFCSTAGSIQLNISYEWYKDGALLEETGNRILGVKSANLTFLSVEQDDYGNYSCKTNTTGVQKHDYLLLVSPATVVSITPSPMVIVDEMASVLLQCVAGGGPGNMIQWYHNNSLLPGQTESNLQLTSIQRSDGGYFNCTVTNAAGTGSSATRIIISGTLVFVNEPQDHKVTIGGSISMSCDVAGSTVTSYQWYRNGEPLHSSSRIVGPTTPTLSLNAVQISDQGYYSCNVTSNVISITSRLALVTVLSVRLIAHGEGKLPEGQVAGRVEVYHDGRWGTVCDDHWDMNDAFVVCQELGYNFTLDAPTGAYFGQGSDPIWLDDVDCSGDESSLLECGHRGWGATGLCDHSEDASVICSVNAPEVTLRLVGGEDSARGRLEVFHDGRWGTVCDDSWDIQDATVACLEMGFGAAIDVIIKGGFKNLAGRDPIWLDEVECTGEENSIADCKRNEWGVTDCTHTEDAGIICLDNVPDVPLRLVGGNVATEGRVEVFHRGEWGTICDDEWDIDDAKVICRQLGYDLAFSAHGGATFGQGSGTIWMDDVRCQGDEMNLLQDCRFNGWGINNCDHEEDAGVRCLVAVSITEHPQDKFATVGSYITFDCKTNGSEPITYQWYKDSVLIVDSEDSKRIIGLSEKILNVTNVTSNDYGYYRCDVNNLVNANLSEHALLTVSPQGTVFITPERIVVNRSESAALQCHVGGGPHNTVQWYHDGRLLEGETNPTLSLSIVGISDGGHYNCTAINAAGSGSSIAEVLISVRYTEEPVAQAAKVGDSVSFVCTAIGSEPIVYSWFKNGFSLTDTDHIGGTTTATLNITSVRGDDYGSYSCDVSNPVNNLVSRLVSFVVSPETLVVVNPSPVVLARQLLTVTLECLAGGGPENTFQWYHNGLLLSEETQSILQIRNVLASDAGEYNCTVNNTAGIGSNMTSLIVGIVFTRQPLPQGSTIRDTIYFSCAVSGSNPVSYEWFKNGDRLSDNGHFSGATTATLRIMSIDSDDYGLYACGVSNPVNSIMSREAQLTVSPEMLVSVIPATMVLVNQSDSIELNCSSEGGPGNTFQWTHDDRVLHGETNPVLYLSSVKTDDGGLYTCTVTNPASKGRNSTDVVVSIIPLRGPADQRATVGDAVELKFDVAGSPPIQYTWYRNDEILADDGRIANSTTGTLLLSSLKLEDYGNYSCIATNPVNMLTSENAKLSGQCDVIDVTPEVIYEVGGTTINVTVSQPCLLHESDVITCTFDGEHVQAKYVAPRVIQCLVPALGKVGNVSFEIEGFTASNGHFRHQMNVSSVQCYESVFPSYIAGSMFGGTPIVISVNENCLQFMSSMRCTFAGMSVNAVRKTSNPKHAFCTVPILDTAGDIVFKFEGSAMNGGSIYAKETLHLLPSYKVYEVQIGTDNLYLHSEFTVGWNKGSFVSDHVSKLPSTTEVKLYTLYLIDEKWIKVDFTVPVNFSTGRVNITLTSNVFKAISKLTTANTVIPVSFQVAWTVSEGLTHSLTYWIWSGVYFLPNIMKGTNFRLEIGKHCRMPSIKYDKIMASESFLLACPLSNQHIIASLSSGFTEEYIGSEYVTAHYNLQHYQYFHPSSNICYIHTNAHDGVHRRCCYDHRGYLLSHVIPSVGTPLFESISALAFYIRESSLLDIYCCIEGVPKIFTCDDYLSSMTVNATMNYTQSLPAFAYGDPHIVTLDGHHYIFNGKGEYILIESTDGTLKLHGRMVQAMDKNGTLWPATVFAALSVMNNGSDAVQVEVQKGLNLTILVNGETFDYSTLSLRKFKRVTILRPQLNTITIKYNDGVVVEVQVELAHGMLSVIKTFIPDRYYNATRGLLGNYNGDKIDDLLPRHAEYAIPHNATAEEIHHQFALSWMVDDPSESLFTFFNNSFENFHDPSFIPIFTSNFSNPKLGMEADELCNGDTACLFDIAATGSLEIGMLTLKTSRELDEMMKNSGSVVCNPSCQNGVCVAHNVCSCHSGYNGSTCAEKVFTACGSNNPCENAGICSKHGFKYYCRCESVFGGTYCHEYVGALGTPSTSLYQVTGLAAGISGAALVIFVAVVILFIVACRYKAYLKKKHKDREMERHGSGNSANYIWRHESALEVSEVESISKDLDHSSPSIPPPSNGEPNGKDSDDSDVEQFTFTFN